MLPCCRRVLVLQYVILVGVVDSEFGAAVELGRGLDGGGQDVGRQVLLQFLVLGLFLHFGQLSSQHILVIDCIVAVPVGQAGQGHLGG